jgi:hypothetical protein
MFRRWTVPGLITGLAFLVAALAPPAATGQGASQSQGGGPGRGRLLDDRFAEVARRAPGFGGMFRDGDVLKVYLQDPGQRAAAERAVADEFGPRRIPARGIQVVPGQYGFLQLKAWHDQMGPLLDLAGVVFTDVDERRNRLVVGVEQAGTVAAVESELPRLGAPRAAVEIVVTEPIIQLQAATVRDKMRPVEGGLQIASLLYLCTLGFVGDRGGIRGMVVNSHCTDTQGGVEATRHYQPTPDYLNLDANWIGTEVADPQYSETTCPGRVLRRKLCRYSDSAYSAIPDRDSPLSNLGYIKRTAGGPNAGSLVIEGQFRIVAETPSVVGDTINKVGRTTGWTQGRVAYTCVNVAVSGTNFAQLCQDLVDAGSGPGDSGSPTFALGAGNDVELRGILWGGNRRGTSFVYSPIANIELPSELGPINTCASPTPTVC